MIELPEATVLAEQATRTLAGKRIQSAVANQSPHKFAWYTGDPARYNELLAGTVLGPAAAVGGQVEIEAGERVLLISTPMRYHTPGEKLPAKHQLLLCFDEGSALSATVQMWGCLGCYPRGGPSGLPDDAIARIKPSPLSDAFDRAYFAGLFDDETPALSAKAFLATEQRIPGLGNGVLQDILWTAHIHPKRKMGTLAAGEVDAIFAAVKDVLAAMTAQGGRDTERDLFGQPGNYKTLLSKNTVGKPCPVCGTIIIKEPYLGGSIYACPGCQRI